MASNYTIAKSLLKFTNGKTEAEINTVTRSIIKIYGKRSQTILLAMQSIMQLADSSVTVITAKTINAQHKKDLIEAFKVKRQTPSFVIDPSIIGGITVKIGDRIIDNSLVTRIRSAKDLIVKTQVN